MEYRLGATSRAFTIEKKVKKNIKDEKTGKIIKTVDNWVASSWFNELKYAILSLRDMKVRSYIKDGEGILEALKKSTIEILEVLNPDIDKKIIKITDKFSKEDFVGKEDE